MRMIPRPAHHPLLNEVLSITAQESGCFTGLSGVVMTFLNEVLSITAQESSFVRRVAQRCLSSMKS